MHLRDILNRVVVLCLSDTDVVTSSNTVDIELFEEAVSRHNRASQSSGEKGGGESLHVERF